jgi:adenine-specific DNA-methyltransferase
MTKKVQPKLVEAFKHDEESRKNIPTAEYQSVMRQGDKESVQVAYQRRNQDLDPQLVWRGKDMEDLTDFVVNAPPLYIQEKVHPKALIDDLLKTSREGEHAQGQITADLFSDFNGIPKDADKTEFYQHDQNWTNRMILGDSLQVMASLAEREGLRGKIQCIYLDPPYGIKFNSNFQWSTTSHDVKDGKTEHITREPEQVKAFRDTWRYGIHSYLTYLRDRLTAARELLTDSGSIFVQIGDENVHRVRALMDEVFGDDNLVSQISYSTTGGFNTSTLSRAGDYILWYAKSKRDIKYRQIYFSKNNPIGDVENRNDQIETVDLTRRALTSNEKSGLIPLPEGARIFRYDNLLSQGAASAPQPLEVEGKVYSPANNSHWKANYPKGTSTLLKARRIAIAGNRLVYVRYFDDFHIQPIHNLWVDIGGSVQSRTDPKVYVVQTGTALVQRCILMATDPGDLVLDPTCGSGTTAHVAEQWGRRWITVDTSRVALALARARIMGARYPFYLLADSREGQQKQAEVTRTSASSQPVNEKIKHGFVYERVPHITLKSIANNAEIDVIWEAWQAKLEPLRDKLNAALKLAWQEWEIPREADPQWSEAVQKLHADWWQARISRQKEIDASIAAKAEFEYLYDKPYEDKKKVRVAGPFTVESLSPHRTLIVGADDELIDPKAKDANAMHSATQSFTQMILDNLKRSGVQQAHKENRIVFNIGPTPWAGNYVCAEAHYQEGEGDDAPIRRAGIFIGPEFGTVTRVDLVDAAKEAGDAGFDVLISCAFNYEAHTTDFNKLGRLPVLKARMNADLHMADALKNTGKGNLFVIFGEPDIEPIDLGDGNMQIRVNGVDVFHPQSGEVRSDGPDGIACWFLDTDYNGESFFVRHAYFLGANDPYGSLKTSLKVEINKEVWETLNSDTSRRFTKPKNGRIAVKVINHLGDEVMKVFKV